MPEHTRRGSRLVGILGGMGPGATVDFYDKLVHHTPATRDQDHLRVVIWANPTVPSRQDALRTGGVDPTPWLQEGVRHLLACGAQILVAPCNTVHAYLTPIMRGQQVEFISIIDAAVEALRSKHIHRVGLLATDGALTAGLFQTALDTAGIQWVLPAPAEQEQLMTLVGSVKAGSTEPFLREQLAANLAALHQQDVGAAVAGCTEISTLLNGQTPHDGIEIIDPALELALRTIERATRWPIADDWGPPSRNVERPGGFVSARE